MVFTFFVASRSLSCSKQVSRTTGRTNECLRAFCANDVGPIGLAGTGAASGVNFSLGLGVSEECCWQSLGDDLCVCFTCDPKR